MKWKYVLIGIILFLLISSIVILIKYPGLIPDNELKKSEQYSLSTFNSTHMTDSSLKVEKLYSDLSNPTKMTFIGNDLLIAEKNSGKIILLKNLEVENNSILDLQVESFGERGLVGLSSSIIEENSFVFVYYTISHNDDDAYSNWFSTNLKNNGGSILVRYNLIDNALVNPKILLHPIPLSNSIHQGGSMVTYNDLVFLGVGDNDEDPSPLTNSDVNNELLGMGAGIFSITYDGNPNPENPFLEDKLKNYFAYGIRNTYGMSIDPLTGNLWNSENGPSEFDEINLVFSGFNSGWSKIVGPSNEGLFNGNSTNLIFFDGANYAEPKFSWKQPIAPTGLEFFKSKNFGISYENNLLVGDIHGNVYRFQLNQERNELIFPNGNLTDNISDTFKESEQIIIGKNFGLITDIKTGPDGNLYILSLHHSDSKPGLIEHYELISGGTPEPEIMHGALFKISHK